ncbi:MAG: hypothetical protein EKK41_22225 [Hyphomicrobiales bacterium]|nr:MAG: hypothetical protein EKK41_22225 [Hyphomicrobiales bacterium]
MTPSEELFSIGKRLKVLASHCEDDHIATPLRKMSKAASRIGESFSGSWLGYHSRVYYDGLVRPPPGANFSQEWGLEDVSFTGLGSRGDWLEFDTEVVKTAIRTEAGDPDIEKARDAAAQAHSAFDKAKSDALSIFESETADRPDTFLSKLKEHLERLEALSLMEFAQRWSPKGPVMTRDTLALGQGTMMPPHVAVLADVTSIEHVFKVCKEAAEICNKAASHLERKSRRTASAARVGTNVFIGHGRSGAWRELKDFIQDRLSLPWDEFNRVPVAGITNIARLAEMLDAAGVALLVLTAEDEMIDGGVQARMNVVHEAGLFQGRLGFTRAIVLLEDGCSEFSNIQGLGQIRFPQGKIAAAFEEVRRVLEREGLIS